MYHVHPILETYLSQTTYRCTLIDQKKCVLVQCPRVPQLLPPTDINIILTTKTTGGDASSLVSQSSPVSHITLAILSRYPNNTCIYLYSR